VNGTRRYIVCSAIFIAEWLVYMCLPHVPWGSAQTALSVIEWPPDGMAIAFCGAVAVGVIQLPASWVAQAIRQRRDLHPRLLDHAIALPVAFHLHLPPSRPGRNKPYRQSRSPLGLGARPVRRRTRGPRRLRRRLHTIACTAIAVAVTLAWHAPSKDAGVVAAAILCAFAVVPVCADIAMAEHARPCKGTALLSPDGL
jgi:hypothetical protein